MNPRVLFLICADAEWESAQRHVSQAHIQLTPYGDWFPACLLPDQQIIPILPHTLLPQDGIAAALMHTGWGKIAAAGATQYAIDTWKPELLVNLGTCGGFYGAVQRGEILLVDQTYVYDILEQMGDLDAHLNQYACRLDYSWLSEPYPQAVRRTLLVSGDRDLLPSEIPWLQQRFSAVAGDWESGAIAHVARLNKARLLILRGVTDLVSPAGGEAYGNLGLFQQATQEIMQLLLSHLYAWVKPGLG
jgi:adenosylhomocysteine nucleosidase